MTKIKIKKDTLLIFLSIIFYKIILDISYYFVVSRAWDYAGYGIQALWDYVGYNFIFNNVKIFESYFLLLIVLIFVPKSSKKLSNIITWLLVLFAYIPMLTIYAMKDGARLYILAITCFWLIVFLLLKFLPNIHLPFLKKTQAKTIHYAIFIIFSGMAIISILKYFGLVFNLNLKTIYETRTLFYANLRGPAIEYLFNWLALVVNPVFLFIFFKKKKWLLSVLSLAIQILIFSATGNKIYLFAIPYIVFVALLVNRRRPFVCASLVLSIVVGVGILSYFLLGDVWLTALFTHRTLFTPALLSFHYYDFFSQNNFIYLSSQRIFRNFINYPYDLDPPHLISTTYFNRPQMSSNNGIFADAYMNFGFWGLIIWAILLAIFLKAIDSFSRNKDKQICLVAIGISVMLFTNMPFLTSLITGGLLLGLIILYLLPPLNNQSTNIRQPYN